MAQTIELLGATYPDVPAVLLPKAGGGTARFIEETEIPDGNELAYGTSSCLVGTATVGTAYAWTAVENPAVVNHAIVGTDKAV